MGAGGSLHAKSAIWSRSSGVCLVPWGNYCLEESVFAQDKGVETSWIICALKLWNVSQTMIGRSRLLGHITQLFSAILSVETWGQNAQPGSKPPSIHSQTSSVSGVPRAGCDQLKRSARHTKWAAECPLSSCAKQREREIASGTLEESEVAFVKKPQHPRHACSPVKTCVSKKVDWQATSLY